VLVACAGLMAVSPAVARADALDGIELLNLGAGLFTVETTQQAGLGEVLTSPVQTFTVTAANGSTYTCSLYASTRSYANSSKVDMSGTTLCSYTATQIDQKFVVSQGGIVDQKYAFATYYSDRANFHATTTAGARKRRTVDYCVNVNFAGGSGFGCAHIYPV
jgi:hypothetical protein